MSDILRNNCNIPDELRRFAFHELTARRMYHGENGNNVTRIAKTGAS